MLSESLDGSGDTRIRSDQCRRPLRRAFGGACRSPRRAVRKRAGTRPREAERVPVQNEDVGPVTGLTPSVTYGWRRAVVNGFPSRLQTVLHVELLPMPAI